MQVSKVLVSLHHQTKRIMKYIIEKRSKWWWVVSIDKDGNKNGIEGFSLKSLDNKFLKQLI